MVRLSVNVDHVATVRQARRAERPDPLEWALEAERAGADGITLHLRADRRHVQDRDLARLRRGIATRLNLEIGLEPGMLAVAQQSGADSFCLVPENRREVTTEGGLDVCADHRRIARGVARLARTGALVTLFLDPDLSQIQAAFDLGAGCVELHTGCYANAQGASRTRELRRLARAARVAAALGLEVHAGHGLDYENVGAVARLAPVEELAIGHAIVARSLLVGARAAVREMRAAIGRVASSRRKRR
jgi:pyridoxine 5-phosphate synthase